MNTLYTFNKERGIYTSEDIHVFSKLFEKTCSYISNSTTKGKNYIVIDWDKDEEDIHKLFKLSKTESLDKNTFYFKEDISFPRTSAFRRTRKLEKASSLVVRAFTERDYKITNAILYKDSNTGESYMLEVSDTDYTEEFMTFIEWVEKNRKELYNKVSKVHILYVNIIQKFSALKYERTVRVVKIKQRTSFLLNVNPFVGKSYITLGNLFKLSKHEELTEEMLESIRDGIYSSDEESAKHALSSLLYSNVSTSPHKSLYLLIRGKEKHGIDSKYYSQYSFISKVLDDLCNENK